MKKSVLSKQINTIINQYSSDNGCVSIVDIYNSYNHSVDDVVNGKFTDDVISFCDSNCSNGHFSRWTNFGLDLVNCAIDFTSIVKDILKS